MVSHVPYALRIKVSVICIMARVIMSYALRIKVRVIGNKARVICIKD
jgi:hypothetical protein